MKTIVISLGGSVIVPDKVNYDFLKKFKKVIDSVNYKFVIVTGGGSTARKYMKALEKGKFSDKIYSLIGIASTKLNARVVGGVFNYKGEIPESMLEVKKKLKKQKIVVCGALGYREKMTTDGNSADLARYLGSDLFINVTNVKGLYNKDPKLKGAKLIKQISFDEFYGIAKKIKFKAGQHFVLDQKAAKIIKENEIMTIIIGNELSNFKKMLNGKKFVGTVIC
jgi:uridylate kinase